MNRTWETDFAKCPEWRQVRRASRNADRVFGVVFMLLLALVCACLGD